MTVDAPSGGLRVALLELPARWGERQAALDDVRRLLTDGPRPDIAVLHELALTGYVSPTGDFDVSRFAEPLDGPSLDGARRIASESGARLLFPFVERDGDHLYNACAVVDPAGTILLHYRKRHPWFPEVWATPGAGPTPILELGGVRLAIAVCYDVHFLATESEGALRGADALLFPSAWVDLGTRRDLRAPLFDDLARGFDLVVANANWGPGDPRVGGQGSSRVVGPRGEIARIKSAPFVAQRLDCLL